MNPKGRTELQTSLSRAKYVEEAAGDIRFCVFPEKAGKNAEKLIFASKIFENFPKVSERIQMHLDSGCIRTGPNASKQVQASQETSKNLRGMGKTLKHSGNTSNNFRKNRAWITNKFVCGLFFLLQAVGALS